MTKSETDFDDMPIEEGVQALSSIYLLLAHLWLKELDQELLQLLYCPEVAELMANLGGSLPNPDEPDVFDHLAVDYRQLFIGPQDHLPPIQSYWTHGQLQSADSESCQLFYDRVEGFEPPVQLPDHLGNQLLFVSALMDRDPDDPDFEACLELADEFFQRHLSWTTPLLTKAMDRAQTDFYKGLIKITDDFLNEPVE